VQRSWHQIGEILRWLVPGPFWLIEAHHRIEYIQENDAKYEKVDDKKPFISRIEIKPISKDLGLIVKGFNPEREPLAED